MLVNYFGKNCYSFLEFLEKRGAILPTMIEGRDYARCIVLFKEKEGNNENCHPYIESFAIHDLNLRYFSSLEVSLQDTIKRSLGTSGNYIGYKRYYDNVDNSVLLLNIFHTRQTNSYAIDRPKPQNSKALLLKLNLSHDNEENGKQICNMLQQEIEQYSQLNNVEPNNIRLLLTRLFGFERLKFNSEDLEKYIQFKNEKLSNCTEEELNKQAEKFINPHNYPHYFKNEVCACLGEETVERIGETGYINAANQALNSQNPDTSLQTLQISALAAIGKSTRQ